MCKGGCSRKQRAKFKSSLCCQILKTFHRVISKLQTSSSAPGFPTHHWTENKTTPYGGPITIVHHLTQSCSIFDSGFLCNLAEQGGREEKGAIKAVSAVQQLKVTYLQVSYLRESVRIQNAVLCWCTQQPGWTFPTSLCLLPKHNALRLWACK